MKRTANLSLILAIFASSLTFAQSSGMKDMKMNDMEMCKDMKDMQGMDMNAQQCKDMMNGKDGKRHAKDAKTMTHQAVAVVKEVDAANGKVTLAHEAVKSLNWPAMTMGFAVKDKMLFDKLVVGKKIHVEFKQEGKDYVVSAVR